MPPDDILDELSRFDDNYEPSDAYGSLPGTKDLALGIYSCTITAASLGRTQVDRIPIFRLVLQVSSGGTGEMLVEHSYVLKTQEAYDRLGADLVTLGFDADKWLARNKRPFASEFGRVLASGKLIGLRFQANRRAYAKQGEDKDDSRTWTGWNFSIGGLLKPVARPTAPAPAPTPAPTPAPARPTNARPAVADPTQRMRAAVPAVADDDSDLPF